MNVEVEVVREIRTTYLVYNVQSLEAAEQEAEDCEARGGISSTRCVKQHNGDTRVYATWSDPVQVRQGRVSR